MTTRGTFLLAQKNTLKVFKRLQNTDVQSSAEDAGRLSAVRLQKQTKHDTHFSNTNLM